MAHEALIRGWPRLRGWIDENRAGLRVHRRLTEAAREWKRLGRDESALYRGAPLAEAEEWRSANENSLNLLERQFLAASEQLQAREQKAARRRIHLAIAGPTVALALISVVAAIALFQRYTIADQRDAVRSRELTKNAQETLRSNAQLSLLLALEAVDRKRTSEAEAALLKALEQAHLRAVLALPVTFAVYAAEFSPDSQRIVTAGADGVARVSDARTGRTLTALSTHGGARPVMDAAFNPDGELVATGGYDGTVRIWDWRRGRPLALLSTRNSVWSVAFSRDGKLVAAAGSNGTKIWNWASGTTVTLAGAAYRAVFAPDGVHVATGGNDVRVWDWRARTRLATRAGSYGPGTFGVLGFNRNGRFVVTRGGAWNWRTGGQASDTSSVGPIASTGFSPDGKLVLSDHATLQVREWPVSPSATSTTNAFGRVVETLRGAARGLHDAAFSPDGKLILTAGSGLRVWEVTTRAGVRMLNALSAARWAFSPDFRLALTDHVDSASSWDVRTGKRLAVFPGYSALSRDGKTVATVDRVKVRLWKAINGRQIAVLRGHRTLVSAHGNTRDDVSVADFSSDGKMVLTTGFDRTARIWDAHTGKSLAVLHGETVSRPPPNQDPGLSGAFSPDGNLVLLLGFGDSLQVWDVDSGKRKTVPRGVEAATKAAFSPSGELVVAGGKNGTARVWEAATGRAVGVLQAHTSPVRSAVFSSDGSLVVTASDDKTARVWEPTGRLLATFRAHTAPVTSAGFSRDGNFVLTVSSDDTARVWNWRRDQMVKVIRARRGEIDGARFGRDGTFVVAVEALPTSGEGLNAIRYACDLCVTEDLARVARRRLAREFTPAERRRYHVDG